MHIPTRTIDFVGEAVDVVRRAASSTSTADDSCPTYDKAPRCTGNQRSDQPLIIGLCVGIPVGLAALVLAVLQVKHMKRMKAEEEAAKSLDVDADEDEDHVMGSRGPDGGVDAAGGAYRYNSEKGEDPLSEDGQVRRSFETGTTTDPFHQGPRRPLSYLQPVHFNASTTSLEEYSRSVHSMGENKAYPSNASVYSFQPNAPGGGGRQSPFTPSMYSGLPGPGSVMSSRSSVAMSAVSELGPPSGIAGTRGGPTPVVAKKVRPPFAPPADEGLDVSAGSPTEDSTLGGTEGDDSERERDSGVSSSSTAGGSEPTAATWEEKQRAAVAASASSSGVTAAAAHPLPEAPRNRASIASSDGGLPVERRVRIDSRVQSIIDDESLHTAPESTHSSGEFQFDEYEQEYGRGDVRPASQLSRFSYNAGAEAVAVSASASADATDSPAATTGEPAADLGRSETKHFERVKSIYREYGLPEDPKTPKVQQEEPVDDDSDDEKVPSQHSLQPPLADERPVRSPFLDEHELQHDNEYHEQAHQEAEIETQGQHHDQDQYRDQHQDQYQDRYQDQYQNQYQDQYQNQYREQYQDQDHDYTHTQNGMYQPDPRTRQKTITNDSIR